MSLDADLSLNLNFNEDQIAIADAVNSFCASHLDLPNLKQLQPSFNKPQWQALAEMGVFTPATSLGEGGTLEICAISESLGRHVFPGVIPATFLAAQVLTNKELEEVTNGSALVSLSHAGDTLLPWGMDAEIFLVIDGDNIYRADKPRSLSTNTLSAIETLGGEPWARIASLLTTNTKLKNTERGFLMNHISSAAYLSAAGIQLVKEAADYANTRKQFGKTLGEFQSVAHPLADCQINLTAAQQLARAAACCFDQGDMNKAHEYASAAKISANRSAINAAYACHQVYAAIGITLEGPAFHYSRRIRQMASQAPSDKLAKEHLLKKVGLGL